MLWNRFSFQRVNFFFIVLCFPAMFLLSYNVSRSFFLHCCRGHGGSVVNCRTCELGAPGRSLTQITWTRHPIARAQHWWNPGNVWIYVYKLFAWIWRENVVNSVKHYSINHYTPAKQMLSGGILESACLSVHLSVCFCLSVCVCLFVYKKL